VLNILLSRVVVVAAVLALAVVHPAVAVAVDY
jgi:hypothetical protein